MKITPQNASYVNDIATSKQQPKSASEKKPDKTQSKEDSIHIAQSQLAASTKEINNAIGALQKAISGIDDMSHEGKSLLKIAKKIQDESEPQKQKDILKADSIKKDILKTFEGARFDGESVFDKNYTLLDTRIKFDARSIKPSAITIDPPKSSENFLKNLQNQKKYAKEAITILKDKLEGQLDSIKKTNASYESLDRSALKDKEFKEAHKTEGITLERLTKLLG
ncbi:hypothetical protein BKH46_03875 [Helicobacter sp. 12S02634-8]|uniref:hypothetical protein n=1 Tax=Helicobacter sp. 12S02634-8 TaxID=1476199 RepID=UPI000BA6FC07|nr:hypothetical protein [Helicobacter sp. 12S02634-8]PAF47571.1 hypothetical protein BKH46_03875 [Helicobacter sp. 12S02634-8]